MVYSIWYQNPGNLVSFNSLQTCSFVVILLPNRRIWTGKVPFPDIKMQVVLLPSHSQVGCTSAVSACFHGIYLPELRTVEIRQPWHSAGRYSLPWPMQTTLDTHRQGNSKYSRTLPLTTCFRNRYLRRLPNQMGDQRVSERSTELMDNPWMQTKTSLWEPILPPTLQEWVCIPVYEVPLLDSYPVETNLWAPWRQVQRVTILPPHRSRAQWMRDRCLVSRSRDCFWTRVGKLRRRDTRSKGGKTSIDIIENISALRARALVVRSVRYWGNYETVECRNVWSLRW